MTARATAQDLSLPLDLAIAPEEDPALRAVWHTAFADRNPHMTYEQALLNPFVLHGMKMAALGRARALQKKRTHP